MDQSTNATIRSAPTTRIRLYLRASNLPKSLIAQEPDSFAKVSIVSPRQNDEALAEEYVGELGGRQDQVFDETEVVCRSSNPRWTVSFSARYEYGSQLLFFVEVFAVRGSGEAAVRPIVGESFFRGSIGAMVGRRERTLLGSAVFDVQDVLGTNSRVKCRRLSRGGVIFAHIEQLASIDAPISPTSTNEANFFDFQSSRNESITNENQSPMFTLRLRGSSLKHTHSIHSRVSPRTVSNPDTYFEIARPSTLTSDWIVVYRSPSVKESISPMWDEAVIPLNALCSTASDIQSVDSGPDQDLNAYPVRITVFKAKKKKNKAIGSFETTVYVLINSCLGVNTETSENESYNPQSSPNELHFVSTMQDEHRGTFQLRSIAAIGAEPTDEITGFISVVTARVGHDYSEISNRFFSTEGNFASSTIASVEDVGETHEDVGETNELNTDLGSMTVSNASNNFFDYVNAGLNIDFCVAIDFTSSNGDPRIPGTLHYSRDGMKNDYEEAIESIGNTIEEYSASREFPVWGFGAKYDGQVRHIFQCGESPTATGIQGVLRAYRSVFETGLMMSGPTVITSVLREAAMRARNFPASTNEDLRYCVLLILTDGIVADLADTQEIIRSYKDRDLPLSIVMVGIGRADFTEMHRWNASPFDARGRFTFADYRQHQYDPMALSREALRRVPFDVRDYFSARGIILP
ncbi:hypothetical protein HJC23_001581 [Cyclotella cryptica]|uniref:VWFA domain-containing protein n=1 Tax=Cyclotella cryptica TaxID=29204 RepID=A0ABD3NRV2_9STRA|eukprot:CCRYP_020075-RA/>CCRYP_020075-RA protein AED:0.34 eAED:0.34 QI:187/1/1/1/0.83/0.71/7/91/690